MKRLKKTKITCPTLYIAPNAKAKQDALIELAKGEVGWHGFVEKVGENIYYLYDIILYPQYVTGSTVTPDETEYTNWLNEQYDYDKGVSYNKMRFHGHSHVNFSPTPSGIDMNFRENLIANLEDNDFYIFMIKNKKGDYTLELYDPAQDTIFDEKDVTVIVADPKELLKAANWAKTVSAKNVKERTFNYKCSTTANQKNSSTRTPSEVQSKSSVAEQWEQRWQSYYRDWD